MDMDTFRLVTAIPGQHFAAIAALLSSQETEPSTQRTLTEWYERRLGDGIHLTAAVDSLEQVAGFNSIWRDNLNLDRHFGIYLVVEPACQGQGLGSRLYDDLLAQAAALDARTLRVRVRDTCQAGLSFAQKRGFVETVHSVEMMFDLRTWDEQRYASILQSLRDEGFEFTNMAELGDNQENRRKLYALNNAAAATDPGSRGIAPWASFEEFERDVCNASWYHPDSQIVAIDTHSGEWAAMSAITVFEGSDHAYNLFTGTDLRYRGRKLAQAVKSLALRKSREFGVDTVRTSHTAENAPMIAIDTKLGYVSTPGTVVMEKEL